MALGIGLSGARVFASQESGDRVVAPLLLAGAAVVVIGAVLRPRRFRLVALVSAALSKLVSRQIRAVVLLAVLVMSAAQVDVFDFAIPLWTGFGPFLALVALAVCLAVVFGWGRIFELQTGSTAVRPRAKTALAMMCIVYYLPSVLQGPKSIMSPYDALFGLHETLAPTAGRSPIGDSVSQYGSMFGWPLLFVKSVVRPDPLGFATYYLSALAVATLALLCAVACLTLGRGQRWLGPLLVLPLVLIKQRASAHSTGSIAALFSALPLRLFFPFVLALVLVRSRKPIASASVSWALGVGLLSGVTVLNNLEFGGAAVGAFAAALLVGAPRRLRLALFGGVGTLTSVAVYSVVLRARGTSFDVAKYTMFVRGFAKGFGAFPIPAVGLWLFVFGCLFASLSVGVSSLRSSYRKGNSDQLLWAQANAATYFGFLGCTTASYYSGRSIVSGQLQVFLLLLAPASLATFGLCCRDGQSLFARVPKAATQPRHPIEFAPVLFPLALAVASMLAAPSAIYEWRRLSSDNGVAVFPDEDRVVEALRTSPRESMYFGRLGHVIAIRSGRANATLTNDPSDFEVSALLVRESCKYLAGFGPVPLYVDHGSVRYLNRCPKIPGQRIVVVRRPESTRAPA